MRGAALAAGLAALAGLSPAPVAAQQDGGGALGAFVGGETAQEGPVSLVADQVTYDAEAATLTAEGNVVVFYGERTLEADRIVYEAETDRISADGEVTLRDPAGAVLVADFAEVDSRLRDALIRGARAALPRGARFAATEARRLDGRYNVMSRAVFSPCAVCAADPTPLWRIRADRIIHDETERVIHYEDATFDVFGVPILYTPYFRHPDPTLERASGFLPPDLFQSSTFGVAVKAPYYWVIDEHSDATFAPIVTTKDGLLVEGEYRRRFANGDLWLNGSLTYQDYDGRDAVRGHIFGQGLWSFGSVVQAGFSVEQATDDPYLRRYEFTDRDRLETDVFVRADDAQGWGELSFVRFQSLRDDEPFGQIPFALPTFETRRVWHDAFAGGSIGVEGAGYVLTRTQGQDTAHGSAALDYERRWVLDQGLALTAYGAVRGDLWRLQDAEPGAGPDQRERLAPMGAVEARYPLMRHDAGGDALSRLTGGGAVTHVIEPIVQGVLAPFIDDEPPFPDEDSTLTEFDETSLFALRRHTGFDGFEEGPRLNVGLRYARETQTGADLSLSVGRVFRTQEISSFSLGSGLNKRESDYVGAWTVEWPGVLSLSHRMRVGDDFEINRNEVYGTASFSGLDLEASYVFLAQDSVTPVDRHEVAGEARYQLANNWFIGGEARRDLEASEYVRVGGEVGYANECVDVSVYAGRDFTSTTDAPASTFYGLRLRLWAFGGDGVQRRVSGKCAPQRR
ncbi:MAG: LPS assembly protein LptD [Pseudomonadota bacterium]